MEFGWIFHIEWGTVLTGIILGYAFLHADIKHQCKRLDKHMEQTQDMMAQINKRTDELHKEFYDLLKQMNKEKGE